MFCQGKALYINPQYKQTHTHTLTHTLPEVMEEGTIKT